MSGTTRFPVSFGQQRLWFLDRLAPGEPTFNMPYAIRLDGPLDHHALQRSLDALAARHGALRTRLVTFDGAPEQLVADTGTLPLEHADLSTEPDEATRAHRADQLAARFAARPFDLAAGPLARTLLIRLAPNRHVFVLVLHHAIGDGRTIEILLDELAHLYRGEPLPDNCMDYGDFAAWQRDRIQGDELDRQLSYWREHMHAAPRVLALPSDQPRPAHQSSHGAVATATLDTKTAGELARIARTTNATPFMVYLTGYVALLSRYARQTDIVVGTAVSGRTHTELDPVVGMFTNTVPLRVTLSGAPTFTTLLTRVRDVTAEALSHQDLPFEKLVEDLAPDRSLAQAPVIQVQFAHQSLTSPPLDLPGITADGRALYTGTAKLDLTLYVDTTPNGTTLALEYSTDLFDAPWADRFLQSLKLLYEHAAQAPDTPVAELRLATPPPAVRGPSPATELDVLTALRTSTSHVTAADGRATMTEICDRAALLAHTIADRGVAPETTVALCVGRGIGMLSAILAVWWAGGAYVPLDPDLPHARLAAMVEDADVRLILCDDAHSETAHRLAAATTTARQRTIADTPDAPSVPDAPFVPATHSPSADTPDITVLSIDAPVAATTTPQDPTPIPTHGHTLAYTIFTSGSTGRPKGVAVSRSAVANLLAAFRHTPGLTTQDRFLAVTTLSFDIALLELLLPPLCGADLVIATAEEAREPDRLRALIDRTAATAMQATPQTWRLLEAAGGIPDTLRNRWCGGEALPRDLADLLATPDAHLWNLYGPTETTVWSAAGPAPDHGPVTIGPPIDHTAVYILDDLLQPVPDGVVGEVCIGGRGLARGYRGNPRLTARAFRPDPYSTQPGARLYRTGDLGRRRGDGSLELLGRTDHQIKRRGYRIECGEIETALRRHPDVRHAAVILDTRTETPALVAYVVLRRASPTAKLDADLPALLRAHLRTTLPDYMLPDLFIPLPALPMTSNAKVDRAALPAPHQDVRITAGQLAPRTPLEDALARIWHDLLARPVAVGVHDNLFALGGHSLTATRFVARVGDLYGVTLPLHQIFATPTIAELAQAVAADPAFERPQDAARDRELDALSDEDLDELLRAALAQRERRRAAADTARTPETETPAPAPAPTPGSRP